MRRGAYAGLLLGGGGGEVQFQAGGEEDEVACADNRGLVRAFRQLQQMYIDMGEPNTKASWQHPGETSWWG